MRACREFKERYASLRSPIKSRILIPESEIRRPFVESFGYDSFFLLSLFILAYTTAHKHDSRTENGGLRILSVDYARVAIRYVIFSNVGADNRDFVEHHACNEPA